MDDSARSIEPSELLAEAGWLRGLARRLTADPEEALELEQEAWRAALEGPPRAREAERTRGDRQDPAASARPWLAAVAANLWRRRRRDASARAWHEARAARPEAVAGAEETTLARLELQRRVVAAVRALREPYRTAVTLRHLDGLGYDEVARRTGSSEVAARKRVSRGLDELRARLDRAYGGRAGWGVLAFALGRDLPVPSSAAVAAAGAGAGAGAWIAGGATMTAGTKIGIGATAAVLCAGVLWWSGRDGGARPAGVASAARDSEVELSGAGAAAELRDDAPERSAGRRAAVAAAAPEAPPPPAAADPAIAGRVVDAAGAPVAGATVALGRFVGQDYETLDLAYGRAETRLARAETDAEGRFAFAAEPGRRHALTATADGLAPATAWAFAGDEVELALAPGGAVAGQVVRPDELPAIGAEVRLRPNGGPGFLRRAARTSPDGTFRVDGLAPGEYRLQVTSAEGATPASQNVLVRAGAEERLVVRLERGWELTGRVVDAATGAPIADARVSESWVFHKWVTTDADGRFTYRDYPREGYIELEVEAAGYGRRSVPVRSMFAPGPEALHFDVELQPAATVSGRVVDADGAPLAGVYVACAASEFDDSSHQHASWRATRTDAAGRFRVEDVPSDLKAGLFLQREGLGTTVYELGVPSGRVALGDLVLAPGAAIAGRVVDAEGAALAGHRVVLHGANADRFARFGAGPNVHLDSYVAERETITDGRGRFAFADVAPGDYRVTTTLPGLRRTTEAEVAVAASDRGGEVDAGTLALEAGLAIAGRVVGPDGAGLGSVFVNAWGGSASRGASVMSAPDGSFRVVGLEPGAYTLEAAPVMESGGRKLARARLHDVAAGTAGLEVRVALAADLRGVVREADGAPAVGATVKLSLGGEVQAWALSDLEGRFAFEPPVGAEVSLTAHPGLPDAGGVTPFEHDEDPAHAVRIEGVDPAAGEVTLTLPPRG